MTIRQANTQSVSTVSDIPKKLTMAVNIQSLRNQGKYTCPLYIYKPEGQEIYWPTYERQFYDDVATEDPINAFGQVSSKVLTSELGKVVQDQDPGKLHIINLELPTDGFVKEWVRRNVCLVLQTDSI